MKREKISNAVIRRLPRYYRLVGDLNYSGVVKISSRMLGNAMGLTASQIRQDLSCFGEFGQQGYGYNAEKLRDEIAKILGMNHGYRIIVMGVGNLGRALIQNFSFKNIGFDLVGAFDVCTDLVGNSLNGIPVYHADDLEAELARLRPQVAVLTTSRSAALPTANRLVEAGVPGIWNFTNVELKLNHPENVVVEDIHFADSLLVLSFMISSNGGRQ